MLYTNLIGTRAKEINDITIGVELSSKMSSFSKTVIEMPENRAALAKIILQFAGKEMEVKIIESTNVSTGKARGNEPSIEDMAKDLPINIIE